MNIDKTTKIILASIAAGIWANVFEVNPFVNKVNAYVKYCAYDNEECKVKVATIQMSEDISEIKDDIHKISNGMCLNGSLCGR